MRRLAALSHWYRREARGAKSKKNKKTKNKPTDPAISPHELGDMSSKA